MKTKVITTTRGKFYGAVLAAAQCVALYPKTPLAHYAGRFLDLNKKEVRAHEKEDKKRFKELRDELRDFVINNALVKDGILVTKKNEQGQEIGYAPASAAAQIAIDKKTDEINEKISELEEPFLEESCECRVFLDPIQLPENLGHRHNFNLNGFVYTNPNEHDTGLFDEEGKPLVV